MACLRGRTSWRARLLCALPLARLLELIEPPGRAGARKRADHMRLALLDAEGYAVARSAELRRLVAHRFGPAGIELAREHVNAHLGKRGGLLRRRFVEEARKAGHRPEELRIFGGDGESTQSTVGISRGVKLVV